METTSPFVVNYYSIKMATWMITFLKPIIESLYVMDMPDTGSSLDAEMLMQGISSFP